MVLVMVPGKKTRWSGGIPRQLRRRPFLYAGRRRLFADGSGKDLRDVSVASSTDVHSRRPYSDTTFRGCLDYQKIGGPGKKSAGFRAREASVAAVSPLARPPKLVDQGPLAGAGGGAFRASWIIGSEPTADSVRIDRECRNQNGGRWPARQTKLVGYQPIREVS